MTTATSRHREPDELSFEEARQLAITAQFGAGDAADSGNVLRRPGLLQLDPLRGSSGRTGSPAWPGCPRTRPSTASMTGCGHRDRRPRSKPGCTPPALSLLRIGPCSGSRANEPEAGPTNPATLPTPTCSPPWPTARRVTIREIEHARPIPRTSRPPTRPQPLRSNHNLRRARNPSHRTDISSRRSPRHPGRPAAPTVVAAERRRLDQSLAKRCPHNVLAIPTTALTLLLTDPTGLRGLSDDQCN